MTPTSYPSDLTAPQWAIIQEIIEDGRKRKWSLLLIVNSIFYVVKGGIQWRMLPHDLPPWQTVYYYYRKWKLEGIWDLLHEELRVKCRFEAGKKASPSVGIIDSQSVKSSLLGGPRGFDAGKKIKGCKRQIVVDTLGLLLAIVVHRADLSDKKGGQYLLNRLHKHLFAFPRLITFYADQGYRGIVEWVRNRHKSWSLKIIKRPKGTKAFVVLPKRWIVERTFAWLSANRRLEKNYERILTNHETMVKIAMIRIMIQRF